MLSKHDDASLLNHTTVNTLLVAACDATYGMSGA